MINLELPQKLLTAQQMAHQLAKGAFRPIARKYDKIEHCPTPEELIPISQMMRHGVWLDLVAFVLIVVLVTILGPVLF